MKILLIFLDEKRNLFHPLKKEKNNIWMKKWVPNVYVSTSLCTLVIFHNNYIIFRIFLKNFKKNLGFLQTTTFYLFIYLFIYVFFGVKENIEFFEELKIPKLVRHVLKLPNRVVLNRV